MQWVLQVFYTAAEIIKRITEELHPCTPLPDTPSTFYHYYSLFTALFSQNLVELAKNVHKRSKWRFTKGNVEI